MKKIKITPPFFLFKEYFKKNTIPYLIAFIILLSKFISVQYQYFYKNKSDLFSLILSWGLFLVVFVFVVYNPFESYYKPRKSFLNLRYFNKSFSQKLLEILKKYFLPFIILLGLLAIIYLCIFETSSLKDKVIASVGVGFAFIVMPYIGIWSVNRELKRIEVHEDIDFVSNLDLKDVFGTSDKLLIAYQNFNPNNSKKNKMEKGDNIIGVSATSLFFIFKGKENELNNVCMNFSDVCEVGFLTFNNKSVLKFENTSKISISIVIEHDDSLLINSFFLIKNILSAFDNFLLGEGSTKTANRVRKIETVNDEKCKIQPEANNRVIELTYSPNILNEISHSINITNNRKIEL
jgi:hypothetical protein